MLKIKDKLKHFFDYKKRFKNQKHKNKRLKKKINKITSSLMYELKLSSIANIILALLIIIIQLAFYGLVIWALLKFVGVI